MLTGFFYDEIGDRLIRLDTIESVSAPMRNEHGVDVRYIKRRDDGEYTVRPSIVGRDYDRFCRRPIQLIAAEPGIKMLCGIVLSDPEAVCRTPVVAWAVCLDGAVRAVTPQGVNDGWADDNSVWVEFPDGHIEAVGEWAEPVRADNVADFYGQLASLNRAAQPAVSAR